ncbi:MAG: radical SAM protein [Oscillospiraceae bacterium]|nr:radical SAM protein [Oscillospiraceae bacterium]
MKFDVTHCTLCPRKCGADRTKQAGVCGGRDRLRAARAALHFWEEPCISGTKGSGTVFFSGCPLHCRFCQNSVISAELDGMDITTERLSEIFLELQDAGAHNLNLVTAGHFLPWVIPALEAAKPRLRIPVVYNTGGYELPQALRLLEGLVEIYLPDFKFLDAATAGSYANAPDYPEIAEAALSEMLRQTGKPVLREGLLQKGCIVRHLVLPGHRHESITLLRHLADRFGTDAFLLSLMAQYTPMHEDALYPELNRRITKMEYHSVADAAAALGFDGFTQEKSSASCSYTPAFDLQGIMRS